MTRLPGITETTLPLPAQLLTLLGGEAPRDGSRRPPHHPQGEIYMTRLCYTSGIALTALLIGCAFAAEEGTSGPKVGKDLSPFHPMNINGRSGGKKNCLV
jgi:hypothetical protein